MVLNSITERFLIGWRISLALPVLFGAVLAAGALILPETPRYVGNLSHHRSFSTLPPSP